MHLLFKIVGLTLLILFIVSLLGHFIFEKVYPFPKTLEYGVTFSPKFAGDLKLDWKETFIQVLDDLKVKNLRFSSYWDEMEPEDGSFDFSKLDYMLSEAGKREAKIILVLGARQPRWPECHIPSWARNLSLEDRQNQTLDFIKEVVEKYQEDSVIEYFQVENEPLLGLFGQGCDEPDSVFLKREVEFVRSLSNKPIIVSDSGELGFWITPMELSDVFGTTLYRKVYNKYLGYTSYPIFPYLYNVKSKLLGGKKTIIVELQAEPWSPINDLTNTEIEKQIKIFSLDDFKDNIKYARQTGFDSNYLWGVEWWYFMAKQGHPEYLDYAKSLFN